MVIRVATKDAGSAKLLVGDVEGLLGEECVSLQPDGEVHLQLRGGGNGSLVPTLKAVERWLDETRTPSAEVWVGERSYTVCAPVGATRACSAVSPSFERLTNVDETTPRREHNGTDDSRA
jgi:hypothetical protein